MSSSGDSHHRTIFHATRSDFYLSTILHPPDLFHKLRFKFRRLTILEITNGVIRISAWRLLHPCYFPLLSHCVSTMRASTFLFLSGVLCARAVTIYTTLTPLNSSAVPTNTNTATGPAYSGYTGTALWSPSLSRIT